MTSLQKRLAAKVLKVGVSRVWLDPAKRKDVEKAITRIDIKKLIKQHAVKTLPSKIPMPKPAKHRKHVGSRKGAKYSVVTRKQRWVRTVRPQRRTLTELAEAGQLDTASYKKMRLLVKGGMFRSKGHLKLYLEQHGLIKKK